MRLIRRSLSFALAAAVTAALVVSPVPALSATAAASTDWPHLRGPGMDGRASAPGTFGEAAVGLELAFRVPLGSGYSGVAVAGGKAVTLFADGDGDWVAAFDAATGKETWRRRLGDRTVGSDGSHDGPLSSPLIAAATVYALSSAGRLVAVRLTDGEALWEKQIDQVFAAVRPDFGFTTSPAHGAGVLVLQAGGRQGKAIVGLNARSGETLWSRGDDKIDYQSPAIMTLAGREQVVAVAGKRIVGLALDSGQLLWAHPLEKDDRAGSATPGFIGDDRFVVNVSGDIRVYRTSKTAEGFGIEELYRTKALGGGYAPPVHHQGHLYGFRGTVLTCADAATGERVWRSREPGGAGLILVDGHLVVFGARGNVVVVNATPSGYHEVARLKALDGSSLTWPSFAGGRIYLRNLDELAAVNVTGRPARTATVASTRTAGGSSFASWLRKIESSDSPQAVVDARFANISRLPLVEGESVHFIYRDADATDVAIIGSMIDHGTPEPMTHVAGTDLFHRTYRLAPGGRWEYRFQIDYEDWKTDPLNPRSVPPVMGDALLSELLPEGRPEADFLDEPDGTRGRLDEFVLDSKILGYEKKIHVWLPPDYDASDPTRFPLLMVNDSRAWIDRGLMPRVLDNLVGKSVASLVVAFVEADGRWWLEAGGSRIDDYVRMQTEELLPELERRYRLAPGPAARAVMGGRFYAFSSAYVALAHPELFGHVAMQSAATGLGNADKLMQMIASSDPESIRFYLDWNRFDERNIDRDWDFARDSRNLDAALQARGFEITGGEVMDSFGWGAWRSRLDRVLTSLFPLDATDGIARADKKAR